MLRVFRGERGTIKYISHEKLLTESAKYLPEDKLVLRFDVSERQLTRSNVPQIVALFITKSFRRSSMESIRNSQLIHPAMVH